MCMLSYLYESQVTETRAVFLDNFDLSGKGFFYVYKLIQVSQKKFNMEMDGTEKQASQIVFHTIFGTLKEGLGVLKSMTSVENWSTRQELGKAFSKSKEVVRSFSLPALKFYSNYALLTNVNSTPPT